MAAQVFLVEIVFSKLRTLKIYSTYINFSTARACTEKPDVLTESHFSDKVRVRRAGFSGWLIYSRINTIKKRGTSRECGLRDQAGKHHPNIVGQSIDCIAALRAKGHSMRTDRSGAFVLLPM